MTPHTRSIFIKTIVICACICLAAFIAFKFFRTGVQEMVDAEEIVQSSSPERLTEKDAAMHAEVEAFRARMTKEELAQFDAEIETASKEMKKRLSEEKFMKRITTTGDSYAWMMNPSTSFKAYREMLQEEGTFDAWYVGMDKWTRHYFHQKIKEEENEVAKIHAEIEVYRANLTQKEQDKFDKDVTALANTMQDIPETELADYMRKLPQIWSWGAPEIRKIEWWWASKSAEERNSYTFPAAIEEAIRDNHHYLESIKQLEQEEKSKAPVVKKPESKKKETKKPEQKKPATPKAAEKKPATLKTQEPKGKKTQPAAPSKTTEPKKIEKSTIVLPIKAEPVKPAPPKQVARPMVTVKNNIQKTMTGYKKFGKNWYPDEYSLTINGVQVEEGEQIAVPAGDGSVCNMVFAYDFRPMGKSYKKGVEELTYVLKTRTKELDITFSWYKTPCIIVNPVMGAQASAQGNSKAPRARSK